MGGQGSSMVLCLPVEYDVVTNAGWFLEGFCLAVFMGVSLPRLTWDEYVVEKAQLSSTLFHHVLSHRSTDFAALGHAGIKSRDDVLAMGIDKYNEECRSIVMR